MDNNKLKTRMSDVEKSELSTKCRQLKMKEELHNLKFNYNEFDIINTTIIVGT